MDGLICGAACDPTAARRQLVGTVAAMAVMSGATVWGRHASDPSAARLALDVAAALVGCAALILLRRAPVPVALALSALAALSPGATPPATVGALHVARWRRFPAAAAVAAAGIAGHAVQGWWRPAGGLSYAWWLALMAAAYAALLGWGAMARARGALLASLRERADRAEAEQGHRVAQARAQERTRIAREMHDVLAHRLSLVATYAGALEYRPDAPPEQVSRAAAVVRAGVHQALEELREVISVLREPDGSGDTGVRPQPVLADLPRLFDESRRAGDLVRLEDRTSGAASLPPAAGRTAYRVVQEGLTNARKHAAGQPVRVTLEGRPGARLRIEIRNPVPGDAGRVPALVGGGMGLVGLTERVHLAGGRLDHEVTDGGEFRLHAWLPWPG